MKTYCYSNIQELGINPLTGEACAFGRRMLCDLSARGVELVAEYWGIHRDAFNDNWNSKVNGEDAIASVMIDRETFIPLLKFAVIMEGWKFIITNDYEGWVGGTDDEEYADLYSKMKGFSVIRNYSNHPKIGSRNVHQFTGRAA